MRAPTPRVANVTVPNAGFELPVLTSPPYMFAPIAGASWTFGGSSGLIVGGNVLGQPYPPAAEGIQVAFLQDASGVVSQALSGFVAGATYNVRFKAAQQNAGNTEDVDVFLDAVFLGNAKPAGQVNEQFEFPFTAAQSTYTLTFQAKNTFPVAGNTLYLDDVEIVGVSAPVVDLAAGLIHYWKLDEVGAVARADSVGTLALGVNGAPLDSAGKVLNAFDSNNGNSFLQGANLDLSSRSFTLAGWLMAYGPDTTNNTDSWLASQGDAGLGINDFDLRLTSSIVSSPGGPGLRFGWGRNFEYEIAVPGAYTFDAVTWHFICVRYDLATQTMRLRWNSTDAPPKTAQPALTNSGYPFWLGHLQYAGTGYTNRARIDELAIWDRSLSDAEVTHFFTTPGLPISAAPRALSVGFFSH